MIDGWMIYWITRLDNFNSVFVAFGFVSIGLIVALLFGFIDCRDDSKYWKSIKKWIFGLLFVIPLLFTLNAFVPTTKEAIAIWAVPKIANNEQIQNIPENFAKLINGKLHEWMQDVGVESEPEKK